MAKLARLGNQEKENCRSLNTLKMSPHASQRLSTDCMQCLVNKKDVDVGAMCLLVSARQIGPIHRVHCSKHVNL